MLPLPGKTQTPDKRQLLGVYDKLSDADQQTVLAFAEFLQQRAAALEPGATDNRAEKATPKDIPRPAKESVVAAMRRLSETYFMLNKDQLLHQASGLMSEHILQGKPAATVIDELEALFADTYAKQAAEELVGR